MPADGHGIASGRFDEVFDKSRMLRCAVLDLVSSVATTLIDRLVPRLVEKPSNTLVYEVNRLIEIISADNEEEESSCDESSDFEPDSLQEITQDLSNDTLCLMELDSLLKSPVLDTTDEEEKAAVPEGMRNWSPYHTYCERVESRFPLASNTLIKRIGKASYERYVRCQEERDKRTATGDPESVLLLLAQAQTVVGSTFHDSAIGSSVPSTSAYAETIMSYRGDNESHHMRVPPIPPEGKTGKPFICVACANSVIISNNSVWKQHLYSDLSPLPLDQNSTGRTSEKDGDETGSNAARAKLRGHGRSKYAYWSLPETFEFPSLLEKFGSDWPAIAAHMRTKTQLMTRKAGGAIVQKADSQKNRGGTKPPPPTTNLRKERYISAEEESSPPLPVEVAKLQERSPITADNSHLGTSDQEQEIPREFAFAFFNRIKFRFADQPVYEEIVNIIEEVDSQSIDHLEATRLIHNLFHGHEDLFNEFKIGFLQWHRMEPIILRDKNDDTAPTSHHSA
ncbi:hypothetical protein F5Y15DRAFT_424133 [Xylariaceae sp. FL0016]|nr:hypothetical protein F5Y15DRAFT_424133 [Xylariaceae sp. FL0016]